jgi:hypothetical protein
VAALTVAAALAGGCGGSDGKNPTWTPVADLGAVESDMKTRADLFYGATFTATYTFSADAEDGSAASTLTWYQKDGKVRADFVARIGGEPVDVVVIPGPGYPEEEFLYVCRPREESCSEFRQASEQEGYPPEIGAVILGSTLVGLEEFAEAVSVTGTSKRTVAGEEVVCFQGTGVEEASIEAGEACATEDGIVLALTQESDGQTVALTATDFSREVGDEAFELPYPLREG